MSPPVTLDRDRDRSCAALGDTRSQIMVPALNSVGFTLIGYAILLTSRKVTPSCEEHCGLAILGARMRGNDHWSVGGVMDYEVYRAVADVAAAKRQGETQSPFTIEVRFLGGLTSRQQDAFKHAADRWTTAIVGDLPSVRLDGEVIDDLLILAQGAAIDGPGKILGQAGPTHVRTTGAAAWLPVKGTMQFDTADLAQMETAGTLDDVITHEMGHVLGIGSIWDKKGLLDGAGGVNPVFRGPQAMQEYRDLRGGSGASIPVPVENTGGQGTRDAHWRESIFRNELMTGFVGTAGNPMSRITIACLQDLGYTVDLDAAEPFTLPDVRALVEQGLVLADREDGALAEGIVIPTIPIELPETSLV